MLSALIGNSRQVGAAGDFTNLPPDFVFAPDHPLRREEYRIRTHAQGVWVIGATEQAASHAVWGLLDGLGYRLFFLTDTWEVVPEIPVLRLALDTVDAPDYHTRQAPRGAPWSDRKLWQRWSTRTIGRGSGASGATPCRIASATCCGVSPWNVRAPVTSS